jgi:hypothetical protein
MYFFESNLLLSGKGNSLFNFNHNIYRPLCSTNTMTRGKPLSDDLRAVILNMGMSLDMPTIMKLTNVKHRTIERIFQDYRNKGTVMREHIYQELRGRKHSLTVADTNVRETLFLKHRLSNVLL